MAYLINNCGSWWCELSNNELTTVVVSISVVIISATFWYKLVFRSSFSVPSLPPGPRSLPIIGYLPFLAGHELHKQFATMAQSYGPIFKFRVGSTVVVVINKQDLVKAVVRDEDETFSNHKLTAATAVVTYGGQDIAFSNNSYWRNLRKIFVQQVLSTKNVEACSPFRRDEIRKTIKNIFTRVGTTVDIGEIAFTTLVNVIIRMVWGNTSSDEQGQIAELKKVSEKMLELIGQPNVSDFFPCLSWFDVQGIERDMKKQVNKLDQILTALFEERIKSNSKKVDNNTNNNGVIGREGKKDFLQVLIELKDKKEINDTQMKALIQDIMVGGTDTTTTLVEWSMTEIIKNNEVMKRIQKELAQVVGTNNIVEEYHLPELKYLEATVKETFRLHPIAPFLNPRSPSKDCVVGGYTVPKGCTVFINTWSMHRDPQYWKNPLEFSPERFFNLEGRDKCDFIGNNLNFLPFGSGRRVCPGISLANKMDMYILASLLHSFNWSLPNGHEHDLSDKLGITLKKVNPLLVIPAQKLPSDSLYM